MPHIFNYQRCKILFDHFKSIQEALQDINIAIKLISSNPEYFYERARIYASLERYRETMGNIDHCIFLEPDSIFYKRYRVAVNMDFKQYSTAASEILVLLKSDPQNSNLLLMLGACQNGLGDYRVAIESLNRSLIINPWECESYHFLGHVYYNLGQPQKAEAYYQKAVDCNNRKAIS